MSNRIACPLDPDRISEATSTFNPDTGFYEKLEFFQNKEYDKSFNIIRSQVSPAIVSEQPFINDGATKRSLIPMKFGKEEYNWININNSSKADSLDKSQLFYPILKRGGRCVVPVSGFYKYQVPVLGTEYIPYFFYARANSESDVVQHKTAWDEKDGWKGYRLLYLAAIFDSFTDDQGTVKYWFEFVNGPIPNTGEQWVYNRMPVVLDKEDEIKAWLNVRSTNLKEALKVVMKAPTTLAFHLVDKNKINDVTNISENCARSYYGHILEKSLSTLLGNNRIPLPVLNEPEDSTLTTRNIENGTLPLRYVIPGLNNQTEPAGASRNVEQEKLPVKKGPLDKYFKWL